MKTKIRKNMFGYIAVAMAMMMVFGAFAISSNAEQNADENSPISLNPVAAIITGSNPIPEIYEQLSPAVVGVNLRISGYSYRMNDIITQDLASGSGVLIDSQNGYIVTNNHVIESGSQNATISVTTIEGEELPATLIGTDPDTDIALLQVDGMKNVTPVVIGDSDQVRVGELAIVIGNPLGSTFAGTTTAGIISAVGREIESYSASLKLIQTDAPINSGNSGGPLLNDKGEMIGITSLKFVSAYYNNTVEGIGMAIPSNTIKEIVHQLAQSGRVERPRMGVGVNNVNGNNEIPQGVIVLNIEENSPAAKSDLELEDIITHINDQRVLNYTQLNKEINQYNAGDTLKVTVYRMSTQETLDIDVQLDIIPESTQ